MGFSFRMVGAPVLIAGLFLAAMGPRAHAFEQSSLSAETTDPGSSSMSLPSNGKLIAIRVGTTGNPMTVQFELTGGVRQKGVRLSEPERLYFDLKGTWISSALESQEFSVENGVAKRVRVGQNSPDMARVVFDLNEGDFDYTIEDTLTPPGFRIKFAKNTRDRIRKNAVPMPVVEGGGSPLAQSTSGELSAVRVETAADPLEVQFEWTGRRRLRGVHLSGPERLYFDLEGTRVSSTLVDREFLVDNGVTRRVRIGQRGPDITRVVFDLEKGVVSYRVEDTVQPPGFRVRFVTDGAAKDRDRFGGRDHNRSVELARRASTAPVVHESDGSEMTESPSSLRSASTAGTQPESFGSNVMNSESGVPTASDSSVVVSGGDSPITDPFAGRPTEPEPIVASTSTSAGQRLEVPILSGRQDSIRSDRRMTLERIAGVEMRFGELGFSSSNTSVQNIAEIVNPFKARKRGRFYGSVYEYHRNDNLDARNFFDPVGEPLPEFKRNQFGVSLGAFLSDRLNVFGTYDGLRIVRGSTLLSHIATPEMKQGDFGALSTQLVDPFTGDLFPNNQIPLDLINPVAEKMLGTIPSPNRDDLQRNFVNNSPQIENVDDISGRVDYELSTETKVFGRYSLNQVDGVTVAPLPSFGTNEDYREQILSVDLNRNMGPTLVSSLQLSLRRVTFQELSKNADQVGLLDSLGIAGVSKADDLDEGYPYFRLDGYANMGLDKKGASPKTRFNTTWGTEGNLIWAPSNHKLSFGGRITSVNMNNIRSGGHRRGSFRFTGTYTGDAFADFLLGIPDLASHSLGSDRGDYRKTSWGLSFRDEWKVSPKINLSFILGYNVYGPYRSAHDNVSIFWPLLFEPPLDGELVVTGSERASTVGLAGLGPGEAVYVDRNDWAPGIGVAYSPLGNNRLVLRSSYGITYSPVEYSDAKDYLGRNYPFFYFEEADAPSDSPDVNLSNPFEATTASETTVRGFDPHIRNAYTQNWQLVLENEFLRNWTLELGYRGRKTSRYRIELPGNIPLPGSGAIPGRRPNPSYGRFDILTGGGASTGHSLQAQVYKRLSKGFSIRSSFTWDRYFNDIFYEDPSNPRNLRAERALSSYPPKRFSLNYIYDLPFGPGRTYSTVWAGKLGFLFSGWRLSGITNITGGRPFSVQLKGDFNNDGLNGDRPDRIGSGWLTSDEQSIDSWFATEDFAKPVAYGFGNSGRHILLTPAQRVWDISLIKRTDLSREGSLLEFRIQFFNAFNHTNFDEPEAIYGTSSFGQIFGADEAREIEIALKYAF